MKTTRSKQLIVLGSVTFLFLAATNARAQQDPPSRVGRLSYVQGQVSFEPAGVEEWAPAEVNRPLSTGDHLWADSDGRAVIQLGSAAIHLNLQTSFSFLNLNDRTVQIRLAEGDLNVRVRHLSNDEAFEIDTPNVAVSVLQPGEYRFQVRPDGNYTTVIVRSGEAELTSGSQDLPIHKHQLVQVTGTDALATNWGHEPERDGFDRFCESLAHREERSQSARYVSPDMVGSEDLDDHGDWRDTPGYGHVWYPRGMAAGWAPYHDGHWAWVDPWGWTWVDDAPWGFAPFHYGRWAFADDRWGWIPGPMGDEPVYAPALVAFAGAGDGVGWFPLGPGEVYEPGYAASAGYWDHVNRSNTEINKNVNITKIYNNNSVNNSNNTNNSINHSNVGGQKYANQTVPGAMTAVPQSVFAGGRPVAKSAVPVTPQRAAAAQVVPAAAVAPTRQSVIGSAGGTQAAHPPVSALNSAVMNKNAPPPPPVPFAQQQQALAANPGRPLAPAALQGLRQSQPAHAAVARPSGPNLKAAASPAPPPAPSAPRQPSGIQQSQLTVAPRASNPDRPYQPPAASPNVATRANSPGRPYQPTSAQPNAAPRPSNPDRPYAAPAASPNVATRANSPDRPYQPSSIQPNVAPRASNPDRPYAPLAASPNIATRANSPDRPYTPPSVQPSVAPRVNNAARPNQPATVQPNVAPGRSYQPTAQPNVAARVNNAGRPNQPSGRQPSNAVSHVNKPAPPHQTASVQQTRVAPRGNNPQPHVNNPPPAVHAQAHTPPPPPPPKRDDKRK